MGNESATAVGAEPKVTVEILKGKAAKRSRELFGKTLLIGSDSQCDVQMRTRDVAGRHCVLSRQENSVWLRRLSVDLPVLLNGKEIQESRVYDGDILGVGPFELRVSIEGSPARPRDAETASVLEAPKPSAPAAPAPAPVSYSSLPVSPRINVSRPEPKPKSEKADSSGRSPSAGVPSPRGTQSQPPNLSLRPLLSKERRLHDDSATLRRFREEFSGADARDASEPVSNDFIDLASAEPTRHDVHLGVDTRSEIITQENRLAELEALQAQIQSLREQLAAERSELTRGYQDYARREQELADQSKELAANRDQLVHEQAESESRRLALTDELLAFDKRKTSLGLQFEKMFRVRKRMAEIYRARQVKMVDLIEKIDQRTEELDARQRQLERDAEHWTQVAEEVGRRQSEVENQTAALQAERRQLADRQREADSAGQRLSLQSVSLTTREEALRVKEQTLQSRASVLEQTERKLAEQQAELNHRVTEVEARFQAGQAAIEEARQQVQNAQRKERELERTHNALLEREEGQKRRSQELAAKQARLDEMVAKFESDGERLRRREDSMAQREEALEDRARALELTSKDVGRQIEELVERRDQLDRQIAAASQDSHQVYGEIRKKREEVQRQLDEIKLQHDSLDAAKQQFELYKDRWLSRTNESREQAVELAQQASLLRAKQRELNRRDAEQASELEEMKARERILLAKEQEALGQPTGERSKDVETLGARLVERAKALDERQTQQAKREQAWCDEIQRRRDELEKQTADLRQKQGELERQLKDTPASQLALEIQKAKKEQQRIADLLLQLVESTMRYDYSQRDWLNSAKADQLALQDALKAIPANNPAGASESTDIKGLVGRLGLIVERRAIALVERERSSEKQRQEIGELIDVIERTVSGAPAGDSAAPAATLPLPTPAPTPVLRSPMPALPAKSPVETETAGLAPAQFAEQIERAGICSTQQIDAASATAHATGRSLVDVLLQEGWLTTYQLKQITTGHAERLGIGQARVLDCLHEGMVETAYKVSIPGHADPMVLRLLGDRWAKDENLIKLYKQGVKPYLSLRNPHIVAPTQIFDGSGKVGVVTEFVAGPSLLQLSKDGVSPAGLIEVFRQAVLGLGAAQKAGLKHLRLTPARILLSEAGVVKLVGYGAPDWLVKIHRCEAGKGMSRYSAPELSTGETIDARADMFSLGAIFVALATGQDQRGAAVRLPATYPAGLNAVLARATAEQVSQRYRTATELLQALDSSAPAPGARLADLWPLSPAKSVTKVSAGTARRAA